jgi:hypothetical protein
MEWLVPLIAHHIRTGEVPWLGTWRLRLIVFAALISVLSEGADGWQWAAAKECRSLILPFAKLRRPPPLATMESANMSAGIFSRP